MPSNFEQLPWLVLSRICEYLDDDNDDDAWDLGRRDLWSFSLASRGCCAVAASQRFSQVRVVAGNTHDLVRVLEQCVEVLDRDGGRYHYVRRLKIIPPDQAEPDDWWRSSADAPAAEDMQLFCRPSIKWFWEHGMCALGSATGDEPWPALARFIGRLPALRDLVWGFRNMPPPVLAAIHAAGHCRLHMHRFRLDSVVVGRRVCQVVAVDPDDYAVATSPALCSIVAQARDFETNGNINFNFEAVLGMVAGAAPNLEHVWVVGSPASDSPSLQQAYALGKPPAPPDHPLFFPKADQVGSLQSLFFIAAVPDMINAWAARADTSKLRRLGLNWEPTCGGMLTGIAARGQLASLTALWLQDTKMDAGPAVSQLLAALRPHSLRYLQLDGHVNDELFEAVLNHQGASLRHLSMATYLDDRFEPAEDDAPPPPFVLTPALAARLAEACVNLEYAMLPVDRTLGDARECATYRGLGRLPRLTRLLLQLRFTCPPKTDESVAEVLEDGFEDPRQKIPRAYFKQVFANAALDAGLSRAIFDLVGAPNGRLQYLELVPQILQTPSTPAFHWRFYNLLRWLAQPWVCERSIRGADPTHVETREMQPLQTHQAGREWQGLAQGVPFELGRVYVEAFGDLWPQAMNRPRWWEGWSSMPLCPDGRE